MSYPTRAGDTAYAHKDDVLMVFEHDAVWVDGTAIQVEDCQVATRGVFRVGARYYAVPTKTRDVTDATFTTTCARCAAPLESADATADAVSKAHEASCIIPGDGVRWDCAGAWLEGKLLGIDPGVAEVVVARSSASSEVGRTVSVLVENIRRISRPDQAVSPVLVGRIDGYHTGATWVPLNTVGSLKAGDIVRVKYDPLVSFREGEIEVTGVIGDAVQFGMTPWRRIPTIADMDYLYVVRQAPADPLHVRRSIQSEREAKRVKYLATPAYQHTVAGWNRKSVTTCPPPDPLDVEYDGAALRSLLDTDALASREGPGAFRRHFTPVQRAAVSAHWSAELRSRIAASSERARLTVVAPDLELETANCKDAE